MVFRKKYLIYPKFQIALVIANAVLVSAILFVVFAFASQSMAEMANLGKASGLPETHPYFEFLQFQTQVLARNLLIAGAVAFVVSTLFSIWLSHRVVGPIVRLTGHLRRRNNGEATGDVRFRKYDFFHELAEQVNSALNRKGK